MLLTSSANLCVASPVVRSRFNVIFWIPNLQVTVLVQKGVGTRSRTHFHPKRIENLKKSNILVNIRFVAKHQISEISLKTSDLMLKHQKWQH